MLYVRPRLVADYAAIVKRAMQAPDHDGSRGPRLSGSLVCLVAKLDRLHRTAPQVLSLLFGTLPVCS